jgi:hypothetical protein
MTVIAPARTRRPVGAIVVVIAQTGALVAYLGGTVAPYLGYFVLGHRPLFSSDRPDIAPSQILPGWLYPLDLAAMLVTVFGPYLFLTLSFAGGYAIATNRRLRVILGVLTALCVAATVFTLTPLGRDLVVWMLD